MIRFFSLFAVLMFVSLPVMAQEDADTVLSEQEATPQQKEIKEQTDGHYEERLTLAKQMHEIWPIRQKVESALDVIAEQTPEDQRLEVKNRLRKSIKVEALEEASIDAMADIFTTEELKKMIDFYGSKEGRSITFKTKDYEKALQPVLVKMLDKALLDAKMGSQSIPQ